MIKWLALLLLVALAGAFSVEVNNIHYGYRNIYISDQYSLSGSRLLLTNYRLSKEELTPDVIGFIKTEGNEAAFDLNALVRGFEAEEIDPESPFLTFRFFEKPFIVVSISSESQSASEVEVINLLSSLGRNPSELDL